MAGGVPTASHYQVLGVSADASHEVVKRVYVEEALRLREPAVGQSEATVAARRAEVEAAWRVLRNPAARAAYDRELAGELAGARQPASAARRAAPDIAAGAAELDASDPQSPSGAGSRARWGYAVAAVVVLAAVVWAGRVVVTAPEDLEVETREQFAVGSCVTREDADELTEVPCSREADAEVVARLVFPTVCPGGSVAVVLEGSPTQLCLRALEGPD